MLACLAGDLFGSTGCLQLLEVLKIYWNLKTLLEMLEISLNLYGPPGNFYVKCR